MPHITESFKAELIAKVVDTALRKLGEDQAPAVAGFMRNYFADVPPEDIHGETVDTLFGAAFAHWRFGSHRKPGTPLVRVYNPQLEEHGWRSEHTIVEIVTDDMPFLVASVTAELNRHDLAVALVIHPVERVRRDGDGNLLGVAAADEEGDDVLAESFMHVEVTHQSGGVLDQIAADLKEVLGEVRAAVEDWSPMRERLRAIIDAPAPSGDHIPEDDVAEVREFLDWIYHHNFAILGYRKYTLQGEGEDARVEEVPDAGLGLLRDPDFVVLDALRDLESTPAEVRQFISRPDMLVVTKGNRVSRVHRPVHMDTIGVKEFDGVGRVVGLHLIVGLFTAGAYNRSPHDIPLLRRKLQKAIEMAGFKPQGHDARALIHIVANFPRDELLQVSAEHLFKTSIRILHLQDRQRVALFIRRDDFERFITCLVYVPRDRYTTDLRLRIQAILERAFAGKVTANYGELGDSPLARLYAIVRTTPGQIPEYNAAEIEEEIVAASRSWSDHLLTAVTTAHGEEIGFAMHRRYGAAFPPGYQDRFNADQAVADMDKIEQTLESGTLGMTVYRPFDAADHQLRFKLFHPDEPIVLSQVLPMLEDLGLRVIDEVPHNIQVQRDGGRNVLIHDFGLETESGAAVDLGKIRDNFQNAFFRVWQGEVESDGFNSLVLDAGLTCREVVVLRAYCKYLRQAGIAFSQEYMEQTLSANAGITRLIVDLFMTMFDPAGGSGAGGRAETIRESLAKQLDQVVSADEDRILRRFANAIESTLRTNYFQAGADGEPKPYLSFKLDSRAIDDLPLPRPMVEVFVYSPRMEGVHLRGGKVARGGLRWSDRREDFRTEILGLMKAQMVKNAVIVPVGSKGGFVLKRAPAPSDREAFLAEGIECYKTLIRGLLDITDNLVGGDVVPPQTVVRRDADDPYLVVAADKGTATFSDIANGVSADYGFWLGDAFASGGSQGYDHKKMGITAKGAWESVKRHFREFGVDTQSQEFTVVGVGDMSGDVFGNGMLLSPHIKLLAAFNHMHIFIDPDPDPAVSFAERQRLFDLPRSAWTDYDAKLISAGGGIFERKAKSIALSPEIRQTFGIGAEKMTPNELMRHLLKSEADLLWFGGIGTYVKDATESHGDVGDRANDAIRVNGGELRCKVIGEGANLGMTQLGRIEFAHAGGRVNTDFIDNSAGVDCSDHEVNIKILLDTAIFDGDLTEKQRNSLLTKMTDEVGGLVLRDNYLQTQAISLIEAEGADTLENQGRLIRMFERLGLLNRAVEFLPDDEALTERAANRQSLTRPEISVLFSYCKLWLYDDILESDLPDDRHLAEDVIRYFPTPLHKTYKKRIANHRLRRELIATSIVNSLINRVSGTFVTEIAEKTGMPPVDIARAYIISRDVFSLRDVWEQIEALDNQVPASVQVALLRQMQTLTQRGALWFLRNGGSPIDITVNISAFGSAVSSLRDMIDMVVPEELNDRILHRAAQFQEQGVPEPLSRRVAYSIVMPSACDIVRLSASRGIAIDEVAKLYFTVGENLGFGWLRYQAEKLAATSYWEKLAAAAVIEEFYAHQRDVTQGILETAGSAANGAIDAWSASRKAAVERARGLVTELEAASAVDLSMLTVASRQLGSLIER